MRADGQGRGLVRHREPRLAGLVAGERRDLALQPEHAVLQQDDPVGAVEAMPLDRDDVAELCGGRPHGGDPRQRGGEVRLRADAPGEHGERGRTAGVGLDQDDRHPVGGRRPVLRLQRRPQPGDLLGAHRLGRHLDLLGLAGEMRAAAARRAGRQRSTAGRARAARAGAACRTRAAPRPGRPAVRTRSAGSAGRAPAAAPASCGRARRATAGRRSSSRCSATPGGGTGSAAARRSRRSSSTVSGATAVTLALAPPSAPLTSSSGSHASSSSRRTAVTPATARASSRARPRGVEVLVERDGGPRLGLRLGRRRRGAAARHLEPADRDLHDGLGGCGLRLRARVGDRDREPERAARRARHERSGSEGSGRRRSGRRGGCGRLCRRRGRRHARAARRRASRARAAAPARLGRRGGAPLRRRLRDRHEGHRHHALGGSRRLDRAAPARLLDDLDRRHGGGGRPPATRRVARALGRLLRSGRRAVGSAAGGRPDRSRRSAGAEPAPAAPARTATAAAA